MKLRRTKNVPIFGPPCIRVQGIVGSIKTLKAPANWEKRGLFPSFEISRYRCSVVRSQISYIP